MTTLEGRRNQIFGKPITRHGPCRIDWNGTVLPNVTICITLDESYFPDEDIELFLSDKFQDIKLTHRLHAYIPSGWPLPDVLNQLVRKSLGQFIYASTVMDYVPSIQHKPTYHLDMILSICPPQKDLPFAELDALHMHILASTENIEPVLDILSKMRKYCGSVLTISSTI